MATVNKISVEITETEMGGNPYTVMSDNLKGIKMALTDVLESGILGHRNKAHINNAIARVERVSETFDNYATDVLEHEKRKAIRSKLSDATPEQLEKVAAILG